MGGTTKAAIAAPISASQVRSFGPTTISGRAKSIAAFQSEITDLARLVLAASEVAAAVLALAMVDQVALVFSLGCGQGLVITSIEKRSAHERQRPMYL